MAGSGQRDRLLDSTHSPPHPARPDLRSIKVRLSVTIDFVLVVVVVGVGVVYRWVDVPTTMTTTRYITG